MTEYVVTYHLTPEQEAAISDMTEAGQTIQSLFSLMMHAGSRWDIDKKIEVWAQLSENGKKNRNAM